LLAVVLAVMGILFVQPRWLLSVFMARTPGVAYFADTDEPIVALTIDDGPDSVSTPKILRVLSRHQARATFFLISSRVPGNESLVSAIVERGHELGNHLTRDEPSISLSPIDFEAALLEAHTVISTFGEVRWFRPGSGWHNTEMLNIVQRHNYRCALGSVYPYDDQIPSAWFAEKHILFNVRPGSIIVLHDVGSRGERTATTLDNILPRLKKRGYRVVTLTELLGETATLR
jgi:peptidoglycan/xylan/chitin deacetylase (PgdA/CDA1 family)